MLDVWSIRTVSRTALIAAVAAAAVATQARAAEPDSPRSESGPLTLERAMTLASKSFALRAADFRSGAARHRVGEADRAPNPALSVAAENFGGGVGSGRLETTLEVAQTLELGGDRPSRRAVAEGESRLARADADVLRRQILLATAERFTRVWSLQQRLAKLREREELTGRAIEAAAARHRAGAAPRFEQSRAEGQALAQAVERRRVEGEHAIARRDLASSWGDREAAFDSLILPAPEGAPLALATESPELERARALEALQTARLRAARAARIPDVTVSGGVRRLEEADGIGFVAGIGLTLPLWSRGRDAVAATRKEAEAAALDREAASRGRETEAANAAERLRAASAAYDTLRARVVPVQRGLVDELAAAYHTGRLGYTDLVAEQRNLLEAELALIEAQADLELARTRLILLGGEGGAR